MKNKRNLALVITGILIIAASLFYLNSTSKSASTEKAALNGDAQLIENVIEIEKDLVLLESHSLSFDEFKNKTGEFIHSYHKDAYFDGKEKVYTDGIGSLAISTKTPVYQYISKVCTSKDEAYKYVFVKIPLEGTTSQWSKEYIFKSENGEWKVFSDTNYYLMVDKKEPKRIIEKFTNFNGKAIEYDYIKILE